MKKFLFITFICACFLSIASFVSGADKTVRVTWSQVIPDPTGAVIIGWNVYRSETPGVYTKGTYWVRAVYDNVVRPEYSVSNTITQPAVGGVPKPYYFVVTAYTSNTESDFSSEVSTTIQPESPKVPGKPTNIMVEQQ